MTQFSEWLCLSWGSLSTSVNGHWCCSLHWMYVFLPMSTVTSHYLRSFGGCSGRCPWWKLYLPLNPPQGSLTGRMMGDHTTIILLWCHLHFTPCGGKLACGRAGAPVPCMTDAYTQGNANLWCDEKKSVLVEDMWLSMLVCHFIREDVCHDLMYHLPGLFFPPILDLPLSPESICLH